MSSTIVRFESMKRMSPCIWMQAGVVKKKSCKIDFQCAECRFDMAMRSVVHENNMSKRSGKGKEGKRNRIVLWKDKLRRKPVKDRPCIHYMKGRIGFRNCTNEYRCGNCDFDQYFQDQYSVHAIVNPVDVLSVKGFKIPQGYYFHAGHTWAKIEENSSVRVGLDDFALRLMGPLDSIESPLIGKEVRQGRGEILVLRGGNRASMPSPISGVITATNPAVREKGSLANEAPYSHGWVMKVQASDLRNDFKGLMINRESNAFLDKQIDKLYGLIEETKGPLAADGGYLGNDIFGAMPEVGWDRLIRTFLWAGENVH